MPRLLWIGDAVAPTGFARVTHNVLSHLAATWEVSVLGSNYRGDPHAYPYPIYPAHVSRAGDPYGIGRYRELVARLQPDVVLVNQNPDVVAAFAAEHAQLPKWPQALRPKLVAYVPVDGFGVSCAPDLNALDAVIAYTRFGAQQLLEGGYHGPMTVVPHGVDTTLYFPRDKTEARVHLGVPELNDPSALVIGNLNRNQPRKRLDLTLLGFARWLQQTQWQGPAYLWLHCADEDVSGSLKPLAQLLGIEYQVLWAPPGLTTWQGAEEAELPWLYSAWDIHLSTTLGEGWGLCVSPETLIETSHGHVKTMAHVKRGDMVMTGDGTCHRVRAKRQRIATTLSVTVKGMPRLLVTPEHPFLSLPKRSNPATYYTRHPLDGLAWVCANQLRPGDFVATPRPKATGHLPCQLDLFEMITTLPVSADVIHVWCPMGYSPFGASISIAGIQRRYHVSKRVAEDARRVLMGTSLPSRGLPRSDAGQLAEQIRADEVFTPNRQMALKRYVKVDEDFLTFVGWYLAEGSNNGGHGIEIDLHKREVGIAEWIGTYIQETFGLKCLIEVYGNKCRVRTSSRIIAAFMEILCGSGAHNKSLHPLFMLSPHALAPLIRAYFLGDGHEVKSSGKYGVSTVSTQLAWQVRSILATVGIACNIRQYQRWRSTSHDFFANSPYWLVEVGGDAHERFMQWIEQPSIWKQTRKRAITALVTEDYLFLPVKAIVAHLPLVVMDIQVEGQHDFVGNGVLLHNSTLESMACGCPNLVPSWSALAEWPQGNVVAMRCTDQALIQPQGTLGGVVTSETVAKSLEVLVQDVAGRQQLAADGLALAQQPQFRWEAVAVRIDAVLRLVLAERAYEVTVPEAEGVTE